MCGASAMSIREVAGRVGRDIKDVQCDIVALLNAGVLSRGVAGGASLLMR
jgi:predicted transcriptional regulator